MEDSVLSNTEILVDLMEQFWLEKVYTGVIANADMLESTHRFKQFKLEDNHEPDEAHGPDSLCLHITLHGYADKKGIKVILRTTFCKFALVVDGATKEFPFYRCADLIDQLGIEMKRMLQEK